MLPHPTRGKDSNLACSCLGFSEPSDHCGDGSQARVSRGSDLVPAACLSGTIALWVPKSSPGGSLSYKKPPHPKHSSQIERHRRETKAAGEEHQAGPEPEAAFSCRSTQDLSRASEPSGLLLAALPVISDFLSVSSQPYAPVSSDLCHRVVK